MKRRTKAVLLVGGVAVAAVVAMYVMLSSALARVIDPHGYCETGFSKLIDCNLHWSTTTTSQSTPIFTTPANATSTVPSGARETIRPISVDVTAWAVARCPGDYITRHLLCAVPSDAAPVQAASDDLATGLPRPRPWLLTTAKNSPFIESVHIETPLDLAGVLRFYRAELSKRGWSENDGAVVEPAGAVIAFTTSDGPALLRLTRQDDRTIADLSRRKPAATNAGVLPRPGQVKLRLGNATDEEAVITVNGQTIKLAARAGIKLTDTPAIGPKSSDGQEIDLPPGKYKVTLKVAGGAAQNREFEVAADETWGLLASSAGVPIPLHLY
ncbi:MAG: hypothetical protein K2X57_06165 [Xanthobacteraceae bacterium]|nr:hypothetical protein [Xanthobacteraceae bacterium]